MSHLKHDTSALGEMLRWSDVYILFLLKCIPTARCFFKFPGCSLTHSAPAWVVVMVRLFPRSDLLSVGEDEPQDSHRGDGKTTRELFLAGSLLMKTHKFSGKQGVKTEKNANAILPLKKLQDFPGHIVSWNLLTSSPAKKREDSIGLKS